MPMDHRSSASCAAIVLIAALLMTPRDAAAYIDPGTGSFVVQGVIAAIVGAGVTAKLFWGRIVRRLGGKPTPTTTDDDDDA